MVNQFDVKLWVNKNKETRIEFALNNSLPQSNKFKIHITLKVKEICRDYRVQILRQVFI